MIFPEMDKLENWGSKYSLVVLAARRAKQLKSGAPTLVDTGSRNPLTVALEEIAAGAVTCRYPETDAVPLSPESPEVAQLLAIREEPAAEAPGEIEPELALGLDETAEKKEAEVEEEPEDETKQSLGAVDEEADEEEEAGDEDDEGIASPLDLLAPDLEDETLQEVQPLGEDDEHAEVLADADEGIVPLEEEQPAAKPKRKRGKAKAKAEPEPAGDDEINDAAEDDTDD